LKAGLELDGEIFSGGDKGEENKKCGGRGKEKVGGSNLQFFSSFFSRFFPFLLSSLLEGLFVSNL